MLRVRQVQSPVELGVALCSNSSMSHTCSQAEKRIDMLQEHSSKLSLCLAARGCCLVGQLLDTLLGCLVEHMKPTEVCTLFLARLKQHPAELHDTDWLGVCKREAAKMVLSEDTHTKVDLCRGQRHVLVFCRQHQTYF